MTHKEAFEQYLGLPATGMKAFVIEFAQGENKPFAKIAGNKITGKGRMIVKDAALYLEAESFNSSEATELTF